MSLASLNTKAAANRGTKLDILHPRTGLPIGFRITVLGVDSDAYRSLIKKQQNERLERAKKARGQVSMTAEEIETDALDLLVACTVGWERDITDGEGKVTDVESTAELKEGEFSLFTPENARLLYADAGFGFVREQVDAAIGERGRFLP